MTAAAAPSFYGAMIQAGDGVAIGYVGAPRSEGDRLADLKQEIRCHFPATVGPRFARTGAALFRFA
jgi:hypothetical protein